MHKLFRRVRRDQRGFTLIELLVVVAIIGLLAAFAVPRLWDAINRAKGSQGSADLETISGALERYYMDNNQYPTGTAAAIMTALRGNYLKTGTTYNNGFGRGYLYGTTPDGAGYVLIDMGNTPSGPITVTCNANAYTITLGTTGLGVNTAIAAADINSCTAPASGKLVTH